MNECRLAFSITNTLPLQKSSQHSIQFFVLLPIIDIMRIAKWETVLRSTTNDSFKTLEEHPSPTSPPRLSHVKQELNKSSDHLLPAHLITSSSIEFTDIFHEAPEGTQHRNCFDPINICIHIQTDDQILIPIFEASGDSPRGVTKERPESGKKSGMLSLYGSQREAAQQQ